MAEPAAAVEPKLPSAAFLKVTNPVFMLLLRSPMPGPMRKQFMVLQYTGRKSGRRFAVPVAVHRIGAELYSLTSSPWRHNFRGGRDVDVLLDGHTTAMRGELIETPEDVAPLYARRIAELGPKQAQRMLGIRIRTAGTPTTGELAAAAGRYHISAVRLTARQ